MKKLLFLLVLLFTVTFTFSQSTDLDRYESDTLQITSWVTTVDTVNDVTTEIIKYLSLAGHKVTIKIPDMTVKDKLLLQKAEIKKLRASKKYAARQVNIYTVEAKKWQKELDKTKAKIVVIKENFVKQDEIPEEEN